MSLNENSLQAEHVRRNFSRHADEYERYAIVQKAVAQKLVQRLPPEGLWGRVLEVGCGTGMLSRQFYQKYPQVELILSDLAHGMSRRVAELFSHSAVIDADAAALPFVDQSFDLILSSSVYQWVEHLPQAFRELHRILKPGGRVALALFGEQTLFELRQSHAAVIKKGVSHAQGFPDCSQLEIASGRLFQLEQLESCLEVEWHPGVVQLLRSLKAIGAQNASQQRPDGLASRRMMQNMYDYYTQTFGANDEIPATYEVIYMLMQKI